MALPWLAELLGKIKDLIIGIDGYDLDVVRVFNALMKFFGN